MWVDFIFLEAIIAYDYPKSLVITEFLEKSYHTSRTSHRKGFKVFYRL